MEVGLHPRPLPKMNKLSQCRSMKKSLDSRIGCSKKKRKLSSTKKCKRSLQETISAWKIWGVSGPWLTNACRRSISVQWIVRVALLMKKSPLPCNMIHRTRICLLLMIQKRMSEINITNQVNCYSLSLSWCPLGSHRHSSTMRRKVVRSIKSWRCRDLLLEMPTFEDKKEAIID